jgi:hypothetical protein
MLLVVSNRSGKLWWGKGGGRQGAQYFYSSQVGEGGLWAPRDVESRSGSEVKVREGRQRKEMEPHFRWLPRGFTRCCSLSFSGKPFSSAERIRGLQ